MLTAHDSSLFKIQVTGPTEPCAIALIEAMSAVACKCAILMPEQLEATSLRHSACSFALTLQPYSPITRQKTPYPRLFLAPPMPINLAPLSDSPHSNASRRSSTRTLPSHSRQIPKFRRSSAGSRSHLRPLGLTTLMALL